MKPFILPLLLVFVLAGCTTTSTIEKRRQERAAAYDILPPETKNLVDQGQLKVGMPQEAVYIAWGKPSQILTGQGPNGLNTVTWLYMGTALDEYRYWNYRPSYYYQGHGYPTASLEHDYYPRPYVSAEVNFENGLVKAWRTLPRPGL